MQELPPLPPLPPLQEPPLPPLPPDIPMLFTPGPPVGAVIAVVFLILAAVVSWPLIRAYARRLERGGGAGREVLEEVELLRTRMAELEPLQDRVAELEERLDFAERMLTQRTAEALPRGDQR